MITELTDVTINGMAFEGGAELRTDVAGEYRYCEPPSLKTEKVVIESKNIYEGVLLRGLTMTIFRNPVPVANHILVTIEGHEKERPWVKHSMTARLHECREDNSRVHGQLQITEAVFSVKDHKETRDEDKVPKVNLFVSETEAAYFQALLLTDQVYIDKEDSAKKQMNRNLIDHVRKATKEAEGK